LPSQPADRRRARIETSRSGTQRPGGNSIARPKGRPRIETFGSWGKAKEWRIYTPNGQHLVASDLLNTHANELDLGYLQVRNRILEEKQAGVALSLTPNESHLVRVALALLVREMPVQLGRRDANVLPEMLLWLA